MKFLVKVPVEVTTHCTVGCGSREHGDDHPAEEYQWTAWATVDGSPFELWDRPRYHPSAEKAERAAAREIRRVLRERVARMGL